MIPIDPPDPSIKIHPGVWGLLAGLAGPMGLAWAKNIGRGKGKDRLDLILEGVTRVEGKIDNHIQAHAEGKFNDPYLIKEHS